MPATRPWTDDDRIGVPVAGDRGASPPPPVAPGGLGRLASAELRPGETDLGRPPQVPAELAELTPADLKHLRETEDALANADLAEAEKLLASDPAVIRWLGVFASPLAGAFLLGAAGALGLFVYSQVLSILGNLAAQPDWVRYAGYVGLAGLALAVLYSAVKLAILYAKLRRNQQLNLEGLRELSNRTRLRWLAAAKGAEAKGKLETYLRTFPLETGKARKHLGAVGMSDETIASLVKARDELLTPERFAGTEQWVHEFRERFQATLDAVAAERVTYWARRTGVVTALAPNALVDGASTVYFGFAMLSDLCRVYHLRAGRTGTAVLLGRVFFNAYLAGQLTEWEKLTEQQYDHMLDQVVGVGVGSSLAGRIMGKAGAKATTGVLNYFLLSRLGKFGSRLLRPVT
jgi:putative membrane protein